MCIGVKWPCTTKKMEFLGLTMNEDFPDSINEKGLLCSCPETEEKGFRKQAFFLRPLQHGNA